MRDASLRLSPRRIHAIVGENGAGKSTLLKMLAGAVEPTSGLVTIAGGALSPFSQSEAIRRGVGLVYQHFSLVEAFTGLENLMLGVEPVRGVLRVLDVGAMRARADAVAARTGLVVPLDRLAGELSVGEKQRLEILRVLVRGARALLLDEPTAVLTGGESASLYALLRRIADEGATVAVVTHHLDEVVEHADEVTIVRRGAIVHQGIAKETSVAELARLALGEIAEVEPPRAIAEGESLALTLRDLSAGEEGPRGVEAFSASVRRGEIVGVAGIDGNGQDALVAAIAGLIPTRRGEVSIAGRDVTSASVRARRDAGLEVVHGDRHRFSLVLDASVHDNLVLGDAGGASEATTATRRLEASGVARESEPRAARTLSGGNQQKLVMARALDRSPKVLVAAYPTRGIDAGAAALVRARIAAAAEGGAAVLLLSGELDELRSLSHRLLVMSGGRVVRELPKTATEDELGAAMLAQSS